MTNLSKFLLEIREKLIEYTSTCDGHCYRCGDVCDLVDSINDYLIKENK